MATIATNRLGHTGRTMFAHYATLTQKGKKDRRIDDAVLGEYLFDDFQIF